MMRLIYNFVIRGYQFLIWVVSFRNPKAAKWLEGRKDLFNHIQATVKPGKELLWFHVSSVGEFEQARPVIEGVKKSFPNYRILLTFFSPSGYEMRKNYPLADYVFYLPLDTPGNASHFLDLVQPEKVFFVKYEFWYNYLTELRRREIPTYIFSALFRPSQFFFKPWGKWFRKALLAYNHIFVQNESSKEVLAQFGFTNVSISGDTRLDRVAQIAQAAAALPKIEQFADGKLLIVAGSTWPEDEALFLPYVNECKHSVKFIIAPHEVNEKSVGRIINGLSRTYALYSADTTPEALAATDVLIADGYGYLVSIYRYALVAFIGGGFSTGIHSILEPAAYGMPVLFGPDYHKFHEAIEMIRLGSAHAVNNPEELKLHLDDYLTKPEKLAAESRIAKNYVECNKGAADQIVHYFFS
ncbi:MAG: 3-deoxy-D-manno-octulosonic acid transferase [Marinilabiliales bacterium]|nr:3-deoxy-D-manno-octulosonic acid transferase [Marinilabiliales bacterium]